MKNYSYQEKLREIWQEAVTNYQKGNRNPDSYFSASSLEELGSIGLSKIDVYDYVEDYVSEGEPDFETFLLVSSVRRDYLFFVQAGKKSTKLIDSSSLPAKDAMINGVVWLPRIMHKAWAKLRGELPPETMYGCGGDRRFFKKHDIHPADFLRAAWAFEDDESKLIDWVLSQ